MARFNEETPDNPDVSYFSYGARCKPGILDQFRVWFFSLLLRDKAQVFVRVAELARYI